MSEEIKTVDFVHLHNHSHYSLLDGLAEPDDLVATAKELRYGAMALTDHGTCAGLYKFQKVCKKEGLKPILGCELYTTHDHQYKEKDARMFHLLALAKNKTGLRNLFSLSSIAEIKGKYRKPRVDFDLLTKYHEGLICTSGCPSAEIPMALHGGDDALAEKLVKRYKDLLGEDFYIEIMFHKYFKDTVQQQREKDNARKLLALAKKFDIKAIATNDVHYCKKDHYKYHDVLLSMQTGDTIKNPERFTYDSSEFYIKSFDEMLSYFRSEPQLLSNTMEIAAKVETDLMGFSKDLLPNYVLPQGYESEESYLKDLVRDGMRDKGVLDNQVYRDRIKFEMSAIIKCGYTRYFLILWDMINFAKHNNIKIGCGRGSAVGSLCLYVLGIVNLDPIKYNLLFERFINPERISPPDVDIDFDYYRRDEIFDYITRKYGLDFTCKIGTYNSFKARAVIRYAVKALDLGNDWELTKKLRESNPRAEETKNSLNLADMISKEIDEGPNVTIDDSMKKNERFRSLVNKYPGLVDIARHLEGRLSSAGVHAAGVVVCKDPILMHLPLRESNGVICSQFDKEEVEELGLLKFDCLALKTVTVMDNTVKMIEKRTGIKIDLDGLEPNDPKIFGLFNGRYPNMDNRGIFQFESYGMMKLLKSIHVDTFEDLIVSNALYRPGPLGAGVQDLYCDNKHKRSPVKAVHPMMEEILKDTYGIIVFQEDFMKIAQKMAGFTKGQSDLLRKCVGKKKLDVLAQQRDMFVNGCIKTNNIEKDVANKIFDQIEYFGGYGFNRAHSAAYSFIAYQTGYLKMYYPIEYMCNLLSSELDNDDKHELYKKEAVRMGVDIRPPNINLSGTNYLIERGTDAQGRQYDYLRTPVTAIKGLGDKAVESIVASKPFNSFKDFIMRVDTRRVNSKIVMALIDSGAMDGLWNMARPEMKARYEDCKKQATKEKASARKQQEKRAAFGGGGLFQQISGGITL